MKPYPIELRQRVAEAIDNQEGSFRQVAQRFKVSVSFLTRLLAHRRQTGSLKPRPHGGGRAPALDAQALRRVQRHLQQQSDATLAELKAALDLHCSEAALCRAMQKAGITRKKKTPKASEQDSPRVQAQRQQFQQDIAEVPVDRRVYVDETGATTNMQRRYGRSKRGTRVYGSASGSWKTLTTISALRLDGVLASLAFPGAVDQPAFRAFVRECLLPPLRRGDVVIWDNLKVHQDPVVRQWIEEAGCHLLPLPPYSPDFSPIEEMFSKVKEKLRSLAAKTIDSLYQAIGEALDAVTLKDIRGWFSHRGLCAIRS
jgi:transposase